MVVFHWHHLTSQKRLQRLSIRPWWRFFRCESSSSLCLLCSLNVLVFCEKNRARSQSIARGQSCTEGQMSSRDFGVQYVLGFLCWLTLSRKSAQGTKNSFHITHHPMLPATLSFTGWAGTNSLACHWVMEMTTLAGIFCFFSFLFTSPLIKFVGREKSRGMDELTPLPKIRSYCFTLKNPKFHCELSAAHVQHLPEEAANRNNILDSFLYVIFLFWIFIFFVC